MPHDDPTPHSPPSQGVASVWHDELVVRADRDGLGGCLVLVVTVCERLRLLPDDVMAIRLAVEEACTNVVDHGYAQREPGPLRLCLSLPEADLFEAVIEDEAQAFRPDEVPEPDVLSGSDERPIGGLGWFFIRQLMSEVRYESQATGNRLTLRRRLAGPVAESLRGAP